MSTNHSATKVLTISDKLKACRLAYETEKDSKEKKYKAELKNIDAEIQLVKETDFAAQYQEKYSASLGSLEKLFNEMDKVHRDTRGISFRIGQYMSKCVSRKIPQGKVEDHFKALVAECREAVRCVAQSKSIENDVEPLKAFCQGLADLRYIHQNAKRLISESGIAERERAAQLKPLTEKREQVSADAKNAIRLENLSCYKQICALRDEILEEHAKVADHILGTGNPGFDNSYRFLIGFTKNKIEKEEMTFATSVLGVPAETFDRSPVYFHYTAKHDTILIKAPSSFLDTNEYNDFIRNLYFSFASHLPARNMLFCGVECDTMEAVVGGLGDKIQQLGPAYLCHEVVQNGSDLNTNGGILSTLRSLASENGKKQKGESINDIFEYNELFPDNPQKFVFFCVNNYPAGFNSVSGTATQNLRQLLNGGSKGIISVICETTDGDYRDTAPMLNAEELQADCIEFNANGDMLFNGQPATYDITAPSFTPREYWNTLDKYFKSAASISLESLLKASDRSFNKPEPIGIPIGNSDGEIYNLQLSECTDKLFGLIIGTIGSGKSAFLHTLILSAAYNNSPEDLQFYLADFKDGSGSTEFSHYRKEEGVNNLYIPHVRYLLLKGKSESAFDLLEKIESIRSKRAEILTRAGCSQVTDYNNSEAVRSGREPKLPHVIFVIDEYNAMLNGGNGGDKGMGQSSNSSEIATAIANKIKNLISTVRAYGIGIILCGQSVDKALKNGQALGNMGCRISLPVKSDSELVSLFDLDSYDAKKQMQKLAGQGDALVSVGNTTNLRYVRTAYSGKTNGAQQLRIAESIRQKYAGIDYTQVEAGSEDAVLVTDVAESDIGYRAQENEILLEMGVSSANALRMPLVYSSAEAAVNYFACTGKEKLCKIERNAMFAFLQKTVEIGKPADMAPITYLAMLEKEKECLDPYFKAVPALAKHIDVVTNKTDMAKKIIEFRQLYRERKRAVDKGTASKFDPLFLVVRDVAWLNDKEAEWLPDFAAEKVKESTATVAAGDSADAKAMSALGEKSGQTFSPDALSMLSSFGGGSISISAAPKKSASSDRFTVADVKTALATLYAQGNKYGIFLLVSSETYKPVTDILLAEADDKNIALSKYGIFGSFEEVKRHTVDLAAPKDCIFITYFNSKTRLYDYTPDTCRAWWNELTAKLGKK
ncbi:MAG: hypothetical protein IJY50_09490 [Clostridia bacterium]|nr:hypothetical protein [Clostridia bacterium]